MQVILKNDGIFIYEDFQLSRIASRLRELQTDKVFSIRRKDHNEIQAYLVSEAWYQSRILLVPEPLSFWEDVSDDKVGLNLPTFINIVNGRVEVEAQRKRVNAEGPHSSKFKGYRIYNTKEYIVDTNFTLPEDGIIKGGVIQARLINPAQYVLLA